MTDERRELLKAALIGLQHRADQIQARIREVNEELYGETSNVKTMPSKRKFSAATRAKMAAAQRKRWAKRSKAA